MKLFYKIIIAIFIFTLIFLIRDNIKSAYNNDSLYIKSSLETIKKISDNIFSQNSYTSVKDGTSENIQPEATINVSGPLKVLNDITSTISNNSKLSKVNIINLTNKERLINGGLVELKENPKLSFSAEIKLNDMLINQYFEHVSPSGVGVGDLGKEVSYEYITIGENLALGNFKDDKALIAAWMASAGHRANILNKKYTEIGVAVGQGKYEGRDVWVAVQHFGLPLSSCPSIDQVLHGVIDSYQENIKSTSNELAVKRDYIEKGITYEGESISELINSYNFEVLNYNKLITEIKQKITKYNEQVKAFNLCISDNS